MRVINNSSVHWKNAVENINTRRANILVVGDSIAEGAWASTYYESWIQLLRKYSQSYYHSGNGIGHIPAIRGFDGAGNAGFTADNGDQWMFTDSSTIDRSNNNKYGLGQRSIQLTESNKATMSFTGDRFEIFYAKNSGSGTLEIKLDGASKAQIICTGTESSGNRYDSGAITQGTHTVEVSAKTGSVILEGGSFYSGNYNKGLTLWDSTHSGASTSNFISGLWTQSLKNVNPDIVFIALGTNDVNSGMSASTYKNNLKTIISHIGSSTIALIKNPVPGYSSFVDIKDRWQEYTDVLQEISQEVEDCYVVDVGKVLPSGRDSLGNLSPLYHNSNHPNSKGMKYYASSAMNTLRNLGIAVPEIKGGKLTRYYDGSRWRDDSGGVISVTSFGAVGDGVTSDVQPFRNAIAYIESMGGGTLMLESGKTYWLPDSIETCENLTIEGNKATIVKINKTGHVRYAVFQSKKGQGPYIGAGANKNLTIRNITFRGSFEPDKRADICGFAGHHHENVLIDNCTFIEAMGTGHCIDLAGCKDVKITNCTFKGLNHPAGVRGETIQIDRSTNGALSAPEIVGNYSGNFTYNVFVSNCSFLPMTKYGIDFPSPNPIGSHSRVEGRYPSDIIFQSNYIEDPPENQDSYQRGIIRFIGARRVQIKDNIFKSNTGLPNDIISFQGNTTGSTVDADPNATPNGVSNDPLVDHINCEDIEISGNIFTGFKGKYSSAGASKMIYFDNPTNKHHKRVIVSNNIVTDAILDYVDDNNNPLLFSGYKISNILISGNKVEKAGQIVYLYGSTSVQIVNNTVEEITTHAIYLTLCSRVSISQLAVYKYYRTPIVLNSGNSFSIDSITVSDPEKASLVGSVITSTGTVTGIFVSNIVGQTATTGPMLNYNSTTTKGMISNSVKIGTGAVVANAHESIVQSNVIAM